MVTRRLLALAVAPVCAALLVAASQESGAVLVADTVPVGSATVGASAAPATPVPGTSAVPAGGTATGAVPTAAAAAPGLSAAPVPGVGASTGTTAPVLPADPLVPSGQAVPGLPTPSGMPTASAPPGTPALPGPAAASSAPPGPGAPTAGDPYFPQSGDGGYHVVHYGLTLGYIPSSHALTGTADLTVRATQSLSAFDLDLSGLTVSSVTVGGVKADFSRSGQKLVVTPATAQPLGRTFHVVVVYAGVPAAVTDPDGSADGWIVQPDGSVFVAGEPQGAMTWFPSNNHPLDKSTYDITVTVPDGWTAVSNGRLLSQLSRAGTTAFRWHESAPMAAYLATASIGRFQVTQTWTANGLPVYDAVDPSEAKAAAPVLDQLPDVIAWEGTLFGPYPFDAAGAVVAHAPTVGYALETQTRPSYDRAPDIDTLVHETAHQWYGDSVSLDRWQDIWLNEGFATYAEWLWDAQHGGPTTAKRLVDDYARPASDDLWSYPAGDPGKAANLFGTPPYERGAMVLEKLRETVGDTVFFAVLKAWAADRSHGNGDTAQFTALSEKLSGRSLDSLYTTWLYGQGKPAQL